MRLEPSNRNVEVFLSKIEQGTGYVQGDPVNLNDPTGLMCKVLWEQRNDGAESGPQLDLDMWVCPVYGYPQHGANMMSDDGSMSYPFGQAFQMALNALKDPKCAGLFNTDPNRPHTYDPQSVLGGMVRNQPLPGSGAYFGKVTSGRIDLDKLAVTLPGPDKVPIGNGGSRASTANIVLQSNYLGMPYWQSSAEELATTLLHELGHVFNIVTSLGGSAVLFDSNQDESINWANEAKNDKALSNCHPTLP